MAEARDAQPEQAGDVAARHHPNLFDRHAVEVELDDPTRLGPVRLLVREVGRPDQPVDPDRVTQLHADAVLLEAPVAMLADVLAREALHRAPAELPLDPGPMAVEANVRLLEPERDPPDLVLGEEEPQPGEAVEHAAEGELHDVRRPGAAEHAALLRDDRLGRQGAASPFARVGHVDHLGELAAARSVDLDVDREHRAELQRRCPEPIIDGARRPRSVGEHAELDRPQALLVAVAQLGDRVVDVGPRDHADADQALRVLGAVLLGEELVVGADEREVADVVAHVAPELRPVGAGEQHLGVDAVDVLLGETLLRRTGASRFVVALLEGSPRVAALAGVEAEHHVLQRGAFDEPGIGALGGADHPRGAVAILGRGCGRSSPWNRSRDACRPR